MTTHNTINTPALFNKGDLLLGQGGGLNPAVLPAGANGLVLTLDNTMPTGTKWAAASGEGTTLSPYIVGATGSDFTTIQAAIDQAVADGASHSTPKNIYIKSGSYTENLTVYDGISLIGFDPINFTQDYQYGIPNISSLPSVQLTGSISFSPSGGQSCKIFNLWIQPTTGSAIYLSCASLTGILFKGCLIQTTQSGNSIFSYTPAIATMWVCFEECVLSDNTANTTLFSYTGSGGLLKLIISNCFVQASQIQAAVIPASSTFHMQVSNTVLLSCFDASASSVYYQFIAYNTLHIQTGAVSIGAFHSIGASATNSSYIDYTNSSIGISSANKIAIINNPNVSFNAFNTSFWGPNLITGYSDVITGGKVITAGCQCNPSSGLFLERRQLIGSGFTGSQQYTGQAGLQTTDNTTQTLASVVVNQTESITFSGTITAAQSDHTNMIGGNFLICARRASGGNITLIGSPIINIESSSSATFTCDVDTSTQTIRIRITGVASTTYNWVCTYSYQKVLTNT